MLGQGAFSILHLIRVTAKRTTGSQPAETCICAMIATIQPSAVSTLLAAQSSFRAEGTTPAAARGLRIAQPVSSMRSSPAFSFVFSLNLLPATYTLYRGTAAMPPQM